MAFSFKEKKNYTLTSVGAPEDGNFSMTTLLFNIFLKLERRANSIKIMEYLIIRERSHERFLVDEADVIEFCNLGSKPCKSFDDLNASGFIDWDDSSIIIRYDNLLKE